MDIFMMIAIGVAALGIAAVLILLARRDARARRLDALPGTDQQSHERVDAEAGAGGAHMVRGGGYPL